MAPLGVGPGVSPCATLWLLTLGATALLFGTLSGFRHAFEPDHLTAVSTMVAERPGPWHAARLGAWWGLGHTASLAGVGAVVSVLGRSVSPSVERAFELAVAVMLLLLGLRGITRALLAHDDDGGGSWRWLRVHEHSGLQPHVHIGRRSLALRPLTIGIVHGLAGSGALTALTMSSLPTPALRLLYTVLFGLASMIGMSAVSGVAGLSLARWAQSERALTTVSLLTGVVSVTVSVLWGWPIAQEWMGVH